MSLKERILAELERRIREDYDTEKKELDEAARCALASVCGWIRELPDGESVEGAVSVSYSGRKELFFNKQKDILAPFKDGQKVVISITPTE